MIPILFDVTAHDYEKGWLCFLTEAITCEVTESSEAEYKLTMTYPVTGNNYSEITKNRIILANHDDYGDRQPFRIYEISEPSSGAVTVYAYHKSYDLSKNTLLPYAAASCNEAVRGLKRHTANYCPFAFDTDIANVKSWWVTEPVSVRKAIAGMEGSLVDTYGGEVEWDCDSVYLHKDRGEKKNYALRQGVNISSIKITGSTENTYSGIVPYHMDPEGKVTTLPEGAVTFADPYFASTELADMYEDGTPEEMYAESDYILDGNDDCILDGDGKPIDSFYLRLPRTVPIDLTEKFEMDEEVTVSRLRELAREYLIANATFFFENFTCVVNNRDENGNVIEALGMYDTVPVYYPKFGVSVKKKINSIKYDVLHNRSTSISIGYEKSTFASTIAQMIRRGA